MKIPIIKYSALEYWLDGTNRYYYYRPDLHSIEKNFNFFIDATFSQNLSKEYNLSLPLDIMVPVNHMRNQSSNCHFFSWINNLPFNSFVKLKDRANGNEEIFIACPELCFVEAANLYSLPEAAIIGCLLCAQFVRDDSEAVKQRPRDPVTSTKKISRYIKKLENFYGAKKARMAIKYVKDDCNSPMEVNLAVIASLPICKGGYALNSFVMNGAIHLVKAFATEMQRKELHCDMVWPENKLAIEYESNLTHLSKEQHEYDKKRSNAIKASGYNIIYIVKNDTSSLSRLDNTFFKIRKALGLRTLSKRFDLNTDIRLDTFRKVFKYDIFYRLRNHT